jgi:hypothetical protein
MSSNLRSCTFAPSGFQFIGTLRSSIQKNLERYDSTKALSNNAYESQLSETPNTYGDANRTNSQALKIHVKATSGPADE